MTIGFACALELLSFLHYLELRVQIFRRDRSGPETHESGEDAPRVGPHGGTPTENLNFTKSSALSYPGPLQNQSIQSAILDSRRPKTCGIAGAKPDLAPV